MSKQYYIVDILGDGSEFNPYRPALDGENVAWAASIPTNPDTGIPLFTNCLAIVGATNHGPLKNKNGIKELPVFPLIGKISAMQSQAKDALMMMLVDKGFDVKSINAADGYRDLLDSVGKQRDTNFNIDSLDVDE